MQSPPAKLVVFLSLTLAFSCSDHSGSDEQVVARIGDRHITLEEFRLFYELDPSFGIDSAGLPALYGALNAYVDRNLAWRRVKDSALSSDTLFSRAVLWEKRQAMLRQLYRIKVINKIHVDEDEIKAEMSRNQTRVHVRQLFTRDRGEAEAWYTALMAGADFTTIAMTAFRDSTLSANGGDLGWIALEDLDENFADAAEKLVRNEISRPVRTKWGYHIIQLLDRKDDMIMTQQQFEQMRLFAQKRIRRRKDRQASAAYIREYIGGVNPQPENATVRLLLRAVVPGHELEKKKFDRSYTFTNGQIADLEHRLGKDLGQPLIRYRDGQVSLGEYLAKLYEIPLGNRPDFDTISKFTNALGVWIRDELLLKEALHMHLDEDTVVQEEVERFTEEKAYLTLLQDKYDQMTVPDSVARIFADKDVKNRLKEEFHTLQAWQWDQAVKQLHRSLRRKEPPVYIDSLKIIGENKRIDWRKRIPMVMLRNPS
jgi:hypothetical protein